MTKKRKGIILIIVAAAFVALCFAAFWSGLTVRRYAETSVKLSKPVRLAVLTDLHSTIYVHDQQPLLDAIRKQSPDAVLLVGDIADDKVSHHGTELLLAAIGGEYPCYYVTGNHEIWSGEVDTIKEMITAYGVTVLEGTGELLSVHDQTVRICGVDDPAGVGGTYDNSDSPDAWQEQLEACKAELDNEAYSILLSHRPEQAGRYQDSGFDLVLCGHAHGGQVRIPGVLNGLFAPNQGLFPKYAGGRYQLGSTAMIISRGLVRNWLPRVFNPPELVIVNLQPESAQ